MDFEAVDLVDFLVMASNRYIYLNKPFQSLKMPWLCLRTFSGNSSTLNSNCGYSSISKSAFSSASLEQAVALIFCESKLDWAFEFASFEFIFFVEFPC